ncbi:hypothetical protein BFJ69_g16572 [Fusarium oxysporum]|uniref:CFEM domain-containing protein n=1 Tax=Fusarium oxysporum TaxID=5507 RepID=A0A420MAR9_FUSOX|nr:hypothetical protein BFJ69_g16572 [Fusarium oxysporum]
MKAFFFIAALISAPALGQSLDSLPACAQTCALNAVGGSGCSDTDIACICLSATFISSYGSCIATSCTATDAAAAQSFAVQFCAAAGVTVGHPTNLSG